MLDVNVLAKQNEIRKNAVLGRFSNAEEIQKSDLLEKGIELVSYEEFNKKYSQGHEIYTPNGLKKFLSDLKDNIEKGEGASDSVEKANAEVKELKKVLVEKDNKRQLLFVKEKK